MNINLLGAAMTKNRDDSKRFPKKKYGRFFMILEEINGVYDFIRDSGRLSPINVAFDE